jgi:hypothetical protein
MIASLSRAFSAYSKKPFNFVWCSLTYLVLLILFTLACIGIFIVYFLFASVFNKAVSFSSISTIIVSTFVVIIFLFFANGLNGALAMAYRKAMGKEKTSLVAFYSYALGRAPVMFALMLVRDLIWLVAIGPFIAAYVYAFQGVAYMDALLAAYALFMTFIIHMLFTPAFLSAGAYGTGMMASLRNAVRLLRRKHIFFICLYALFALVWLLNFVPFIQLATLFFVYPVVYGAMISLLETGMRIETEGED